MSCCRSLSSLAFLLLCLTGASCLAPTNPFDPDTPAALQEPGSLSGTVVLDDPTAPSDALALERAAVRVALVDELGNHVQENGADLTVTLIEPTDNDGNARFTFSTLTPGVYTPLILHVWARYARPQVPTVRVLAGATASVGELRFTLTSADRGGPGVSGWEEQGAFPRAGPQTLRAHLFFCSGSLSV